MLVGALRGTETLWESREASTGQSEEELVELLVREVKEARDARPDAAAVGLGIPATIDHDSGVAVSAVNLPLEKLPIRDLVSERVGLPVFVDNDANVAALAEYLYGAAQGKPNTVMLTVGTGIGGGLILDGKVYRGSSGAGAELGHTVIQADGPPCQGNCPNHGCVEALASGTALGREGRAAAESAPDSALGRLLAAGEEVDGKAVTEAAIAGDETAIARLRADRRPARRRLHQLRQHLPARRDRRRRRRHRRRRPAAGAGTAGTARAGADADERDADPGGDPRQRRRHDRRRGDGRGSSWRGR